MPLESATPALTCDDRLDGCIRMGWVREVSDDRVMCDLMLRVDVNDQMQRVRDGEG